MVPGDQIAQKYIVTMVAQVVVAQRFVVLAQVRNHGSWECLNYLFSTSVRGVALDIVAQMAVVSTLTHGQ